MPFGTTGRLRYGDPGHRSSEIEEPGDVFTLGRTIGSDPDIGRPSPGKLMEPGLGWVAALPDGSR